MTTDKEKLIKIIDYAKSKGLKLCDILDNMDGDFKILDYREKNKMIVYDNIKFEYRNYSHLFKLIYNHEFAKCFFKESIYNWANMLQISVVQEDPLGFLYDCLINKLILVGKT